MGRVFADAYFQAFLAVALLSGGFTAHARLGARPWRSSSVAVEPEPFPPPPAPAAAPAEARREEPPPPSRPKKAGEWIVDASGGPDSDTRSLRDAFRAASDGDVISLRPGAYAGGLLTLGRSLTVRGLGKDAAAVRIGCEEDAVCVLATRGGQVRFERLQIVSWFSAAAAAKLTDAEPPAALAVRGARVVLDEVSLFLQGASGPALRVSDKSALMMRGGTLRGAHSDALMRGDLSAAFSGAAFTHESQPLVAWGGAKVLITKLLYRAGGRGRFYAYNGAVIEGAGRMPLELQRSPSDRVEDAKAFGAPVDSPSAGESPGRPAPRVAGPAPADEPEPAAEERTAPRPAATRFKRDIFNSERRSGELPR